MYAGIPPPPPPWTEFLTHTSQNIKLPQTSFVGGNHLLVTSSFGKSRMPLCFYNWKHIYFTEKSFFVNFFSSMAATGIKCQNNKPIPIFESDVCAFAYLDLNVEPSF